MLKKCTLLLLATLLVNATVAAPAFGQTKTGKEAASTTKVRESVQALGTGEVARIRLKLRDKTRLDGYVGAANEESFTVMNAKSGVATVVTYPQVKQVKGNNLSTGAKIAIGVGLALGVFIIIIRASGGIYPRY